MAEIGTDEHAQIYAHVDSVKSTVERLAENLADVPAQGVTTGNVVNGLEPILIEILNTMQSLQANIDQIADKTIEINTRVEAGNKTTADTAKNVESIGMDVKGANATLSTFTGWLVPLMDDFRDSAILPTMALIDGKTQVLLDSHNEIKGMAETIQNMVNPLLERLETSPLLRMLGVKDKPND